MIYKTENLLKGWGLKQLINTLKKHYNDLNDFKKVISKRDNTTKVYFLMK